MMHSSTLLYALSTLGGLVPGAAAILIARKLDEPVSQYLSRMCLPLWSNATRSMELGLSVGGQVASLSESPFPCERATYIAAACAANGTSEIDFLAEQECLCHGSYWEAEAGCNSCYFVHGNTYSSPSKAASYLTSLSMAECTPSPPTQAFSNLTPPVNFTALIEAPPMTLGHDQFPNNTAVSNYFTPTGEMTLGQITGTATARLTSWTNIAGVSSLKQFNWNSKEFRSYIGISSRRLSGINWIGVGYHPMMRIEDKFAIVLDCVALREVEHASGY
ncbi:hypothetical protein N7454_003251 [Penicillium verhagenii]|nr:hypothetical protein N7454_003251 [Penicillium verhagenii]